MELTVGEVVEGKVKSITNFGAFISLPDNKTGKINLSIKRLEPKPQRDGNKPPYRGGNGGQRREGGPQNREGGRPQQQRAPMQPAAPKTADQLFEEKLKAFMTESDSKLSGIKQYADHRSSSRPRRRG